jgi:hypothetical protein
MRPRSGTHCSHPRRAPRTAHPCCGGTRAAHPANADQRAFPLVGHAAGVVGGWTVAGVAVFLSLLFVLGSDDARAVYEDGPLGYFAPLAGLVAAEAALVILIAALHAAAGAVPAPKAA